MAFCKGISCKKYDAIYDYIYIPDPITGRLEKRTICKKRSCYHDPLGCWRGDIDVIIGMFRTKRRLKRQ